MGCSCTCSAEVSPFHLLATPGIVCGDLDALVKFLCSKGQNANVPCPLHSNVVSLKSGWASDGSVLRAFNCLKMSEMVPHTDATIRAVVRTLARAAAERDAGRMTGAAFDALSTELGWSHSSDNILMDEDIKFDVASAVHVDWLHTYLQTGIFNYEVAFLFTFFVTGRVPLRTSHLIWHGSLPASSNGLVGLRRLHTC